MLPTGFQILRSIRSLGTPPFPSVTRNPSVPFGHYEPLLTLGVDVSGDKYLYGVRNQNLRDSKRPETYS